ncbi:glycosyl transferase [Janthinobacterium lividum]|uniref:glycosyl transferase n=1 Tax=Janthinobacterium lividum TaxID=29581 RepID=UPI001B83807F|nr:glycosyl transferase [Janthinobacterium lividum]MBR7633451.1 glycosyl transferase [Janthinobacterium lividum]
MTELNLKKMNGIDNFSACTIVSKNYFSYALTLRASFLKNNPDGDFHILIVDAKDTAFKVEDGVDIVWVEDLAIPDFSSYAMRYDILELNTNVKPTFLLHLLKKYQKVAYIDPDIKVFRPLNIIFDRLDDYSIVLTPHIVSPIMDNMKPGEVDFLINGQFNLGFIAVSNTESGIKMLQWWQERCLEQGYNEPSQGLFVDQKWINLVPCIFSGVYIEKSFGCNMAYWNLHERLLSKKEGSWVVNQTEPLYFFHFSGLLLNEENDISKYQNRFNLIQRPDLKELFSAYRQELRDNGHLNFQSLKYGFSTFSDGKLISSVARRLYTLKEFPLDGKSPFSMDSKFYQFCQRNGLFAAPGGAKSYNSYNTDHNDIRLKIIRSGLKLAHRVLGVNKYALLLKYMIYIASVRNQRNIFK